MSQADFHQLVSERFPALTDYHFSVVHGQAMIDARNDTSINFEERLMAYAALANRFVTTPFL